MSQMEEEICPIPWGDIAHEVEDCVKRYEYSNLYYEYKSWSQWVNEDSYCEMGDEINKWWKSLSTSDKITHCIEHIKSREIKLTYIKSAIFDMDSYIFMLQKQKVVPPTTKKG